MEQIRAAGGLLEDVDGADQERRPARVRPHRFPEADRGARRALRARASNAGVRPERGLEEAQVEARLAQPRRQLPPWVVGDVRVVDSRMAGHSAPERAPTAATAFFLGRIDQLDLVAPCRKRTEHGLVVTDVGRILNGEENTQASVLVDRFGSNLILSIS